MSRKLLRLAPPAMALLVLAVPARDLVTGLRGSVPDAALSAAGEEAETDDSLVYGDYSDAQTRWRFHTLDHGTGSLAVTDVPGTILREERTPHGTDLILHVGPLEAAQLFDYLHHRGTARMVSLEQDDATGWTARVALYQEDSLSRRQPSRQGRTLDAGSEPFSTDELARALALPPTPAPPPSAAVNGSSPSEEAPRTRDVGPAPFGTVRFHSGRRLSWRWNSDVLLLEEMP